jgi:oligoendopeptidase F
MRKNPPRWDLTSIFSCFDGADYQQALVEYAEGMNDLDKRLADEAARKADFGQWLADYLVASNRIGALEESLNAYAYSSYSTDTTNTDYLNNLSKLEEMALQSNAQALVFQGILTEYTQELSTFYTSFPQFSQYQYVLEQVIADGKHRMSGEEEKLAADLCRTGGAAWSRLHEQVISNLTDTATGKTFNEIRNEAYSPDPVVRKKAWETEISLLQSVEIPIAAALNNLKGATVTLNRRRGWNEAIDRALSSANMGKKTLAALIGAIEDSLPFWREYLQLKGRLLQAAGETESGKSDSGSTSETASQGCAFYDLFAPLPKVLGEASVSAENSVKMEGWTFDEARSYITEKFYGFSKDMGDFAANAFANNWIDAEVRKGKVGGAYCIDFPSKGVSRVLSNFTGSFSDVTTLAHELGHAYHHHCIAGLDYELTHYPMTLAETASIFAENIIMKDVIARCQGFDKLQLLELHLQDSCQVLVDILSRFYFEQSVFQQREKGELSAADFCGLMAQAQEKSYGNGLSAERHEYMWSVKTHYYSPDLDFYNFPYAFGLLFALGLHAQYQQQGADFAQVYQKLLRDTGSYSCEEVCRRAGFDIESKEFWAAGIKTFLPELEELKAYEKAVAGGRS